MAKVKLGAIIADTRGSIGGHTLKWSRAGHVLTMKPAPPKRLTPKHTTITANFATFSKRWWSSLSVSQRDDWRDLATANPRPDLWGDEYPLTGHALFISLNLRLRQATLTTTDDAPTDQAVTSLSTATLTLTAPSTASLAFTPTTTPTDHLVYLSAAGPFSPGRANFDHLLHFLGPSANPQTSPWNIAALLTAALGSIVAGRQYVVAAALLNSDNAALSPPIVATAIAS